MICIYCKLVTSGKKTIYCRFSHCCGGSRQFQVSPPTRSDKGGDHIVVLKDGEFVEVTAEDNGTYKGHRIILGELKGPPEDIQLPWGDIGVHLVTGLQASYDISFKIEDVKGKAMRCGDVVCEWLPGWLRSKKDGC